MKKVNKMTIDEVWNELYKLVQSGTLSPDLYDEAHEACGLEASGQIMEAIAVASDVLIRAGMAA